MHVKQSVYKLPKIVRRPLAGIISYAEIVLWTLRGRPVPAPHNIKVKILSSHSRKYNLKIFIETGTYLGQTIDDLTNAFEKIYSIELEKKLYLNAKKIFLKNKNIKVFQGDSALILNKLLKGVKRPILFWLDAHFSGGITAKGSKDTPILKELEIISKNIIRGSVILIDDAREFNGHGDYPRLESIRKFVAKKFSNYKITVKDDIIRIYPQ